MICKIQGERSTENSFSPYLYSYVLSDREDPEDIKQLCGCWKVARTPCYKTTTWKKDCGHAYTHTGSAGANPRTGSARKCGVKMPRLASKAVLSYLCGVASKPLWFYCFQTCANVCSLPCRLNQLVLVTIWQTLSCNPLYVVNNPLLCCPCSLCLFGCTNSFPLINSPLTAQNRHGSSLWEISCLNARDNSSDIKQRF